MSLFDFGNIQESKKETLKDDNNGISSRSIKLQTKIKLENKTKRESVEMVITELPLINESIHIIANGKFDYFTIIPRILDLGGGADDFYFSTWTMSHNNVIQILELFDIGLLKQIKALTGEYFRTRESAVYHILDLGIKERNQYLIANKNHAKVTLIQIKENYYVIEGSANFTANPRIEQYVLSNHKGLFEFHKEWMDKLLKL